MTIPPEPRQLLALPAAARRCRDRHAIVSVVMPGYDFSEDEEPSLSEQGYDDPGDNAPSRSPLPVHRNQVMTEEYTESAPEQEQAMQVVDLSEEAQEEDYQEVVSHVDRRLKIAQYYRLVLDASMFDDNTPEARIVQSRLRKFASGEIEVLFGMKAAPTAVGASPFSQDEIDALKALAAATMAAKKRSAEPKMNKIGQLAAPAPAAPAPALKPIQAKPAVRVQTTPQVASPRPRPAVQPPVAAAKPGELQNQVPPGSPSLKNDPRIPPDYTADPTVRIKNGHVYVQQRNDAGELLWVHEPGMKKPMPMLKDVTPVAQPQGIQPVPMPSAEAMSLLTSQISANESVQNLERLAQKMDPVFRGTRRLF